jgi:hypothetical protein
MADEQAQVLEHFWPGHPAPQKGAFGGGCNTQTCAHSGADWYSRSSGKYYCDECARQLNEACLAQGARKTCELHF